MPIVKQNFPQTVPTSIEDWQRSLILHEVTTFGQNYPYKINFTTSNVIKNSLFQVGGSLYRATSDTAISGSPSPYVKLTPSGSALIPSFAASLASVTWNATYSGYYDSGGALYVFNEAEEVLRATGTSRNTFFEILAHAVAEKIGYGAERTGTGGVIGDGAKATSGGAAGNDAETTTGGAVGNGAKALQGGGAVGNEADAPLGGGAVGNGAKALQGGGAVGQDSKATRGGAVGNRAEAEFGGAVGQDSKATWGGAVGNEAEATSGCAVGSAASATDGASIGARAYSRGFLFFNATCGFIASISDNNRSGILGFFFPTSTREDIVYAEIRESLSEDASHVCLGKYGTSYFNGRITSSSTSIEIVKSVGGYETFPASSWIGIHSHLILLVLVL